MAGLLQRHFALFRWFVALVVVLATVALSGVPSLPAAAEDSPVVPVELVETASEAGAMVEAKRTGVPVEVGSLASEFRRVVADPVSG